jgi:hypothetical protein
MGIVDGVGGVANPPDAWIGTWRLDPSSLKYDYGRPGLRALYTIQRPEGTTWPELIFHLDADDPDGKLLQFTYGGPLDGVGREVAPGAVLRLTLVDERTIDSTLERDGKVVDHWRRELAPDGASITFTQIGKTPERRPFKNVSVYYRVWN